MTARRAKAELKRRIGDLAHVPPDMLHRFVWMELFERYESELMRQEDLADEALHASRLTCGGIREEMARVSRELMAYDAAIKRTQAKGKTRESDNGVSQVFNLLRNNIDGGPRPPGKGEPRYVKNKTAEA